MSDFVVVSCLFAPSVHARRLANFRLFAEQWEEGLHIAVLNFRGEESVLRLPPKVQVFCGGIEHVLWQKERLLNLIIERLPPSVAYIAWVDADVLFGDRDWIAKAKALLQRFPVIQLFDRITHLDEHGMPAWQGRGVIASGPGSEAGLPFQRRGATGFAWAARRDVLGRVGLMDFMVVGGADSHMAQGFLGGMPAAALMRFPPAMRQAMTAWGRKAAEATGGRVGFLPGTIEHLYHGRLTTRKYLERYDILTAAGFDPRTDIAVDSTGLYAWSSAKPALHAAVADYFRARSIDENA